MITKAKGELANTVQIETSLSPMELLDQLQAIENSMGRVKIIDKGPRNIDLDILLYDETTFSNERLQVPHPLMLEREFVLRPLCEYVFLLLDPCLTDHAADLFLILLHRNLHLIVCMIIS